MKKIKSILVLDLYLCLILQVAAIVFIALPQLSEIRVATATAIRLPLDLLWAPILGILLIVNLFIIVRAARHVADPINDLAKQTKLTTNSFAFKKRSHSWEEDVLKHYIEAQSVRREEMERDLESLELELEKAQQSLDHTVAKAEEPGSTRASLEERLAALQEENASLKSRAQASDATTNAAAGANAPSEMERRANQLYEKMEAALAKASQTSAWSASLLQELKSPVASINTLAKRLNDAWADTTLARLKAGLKEIVDKSEEQLRRLDELIANSNKDDGDGSLNHVNTHEQPFPTNGKQPPRLPATSLRESIRQLVRKHAEQNDHVVLEVDIDPDLDDTINNDGFREVVDNLLNLAACQLEDGTVFLTVRPVNNQLELCVSPQGIPRMGNALDLTKVNRAANALEGKIEVDSDDPKRLRLRFRFDPYAVDTKRNRVFEL